MKEFVTAYILITITGGVLITSGRFYDMYNEPKFCVTIIALLLLFMFCCLIKCCVCTLYECLRSRLFAIGLSVLCLILSLHAILQFFFIIPSHSLFRITGTFDNPSGYALIQSLLFPFPLSLCLVKHEKVLVKFLAILAIVLVSLSIILSGSRCGILACCASFLIMMRTNNRLQDRIKRHKVLTVICLLLMVLSCLILYFMKQESADGRILVWQVCLDMIKVHPLSGYGFHGFENSYMDCQAEYFKQHPDSPYTMLADNITHPYNEFLLITVNFGILGLVVIVCLVSLLVFGLLKSKNNMCRTWMAVITSLLIFSTFSYPFNYPQAWLFLLLTIIFAIPDKKVKSLAHLSYVRYPLVVAFILLLCLSVRHSYLNMCWTEISRRALAGQTERMLPYYEEMLPQMSNNPMFLYNYAAELNYAEKYTESLEITKACTKIYNDYDIQLLLADNQENTGDLEASINTYRHASYMIPCRFIPLDGLMRVYQKRGDIACADSVARMIQQKHVKVSSSVVDNIKKQAQMWLERQILHNN